MRIASLQAPALALAASAGLAAALAVAAPAPAAARPGAVRFDGTARERLVLSTAAYRLTLAKRSGKIVRLEDVRSGATLVRGESGCMWGAVLDGDGSYVGGCARARGPAGSMRWAWSARTATLTLRWTPAAAARWPIDATVRVTAGASAIDLRLMLVNHTARPLRNVVLPADLLGPAAQVTAGYAPKFLPGVRIGPGFFARAGSDVTTYPSRWAFADWLAFDAAGSQLALWSVNPAPAPLAPVSLGFTHTAGGPCSQGSFCLTHAFETWIAGGATWSSPTVRLQVGGDVRAAILAYRHDNGIDGYPSLAAKAGALLPTLARAPLVKADLTKGLHPFAEWASDLTPLGSPLLLHPVAYTTGGHDESDPDFLPPSPTWGSTADFRRMVDDAHARGSLVVPYVNLGWWNVDSPTVTSLPPPLGQRDIAALDAQGQPALEHYGPHVGVAVSPAAPFVRDRVTHLAGQFAAEVGPDCLFLDQLGARPWLRDFNPAETSPLAYDDAWLSLVAALPGPCLMAEDGWDRLAASMTGLHGSVLAMQREHAAGDEAWGAGNWQPFPIATWLLHDKVLLYQHDLYDGTLVGDAGSPELDAETLAFDAAFGMQLSVDWNGWRRTIESPWLAAALALQQALGPHVAGRSLDGWRDVLPDVSESVFGDLTVTATWGAAAPAAVPGYGLPAHGFLARTADGSLLAGAVTGSFGGVALSPGIHVVLVERDASATTLFQPVGADTPLAVDPPPGWSPDRPIAVQPLDVQGNPYGPPLASELRAGKVVFVCPGQTEGRPPLHVRVTAA